MVAPEWGVQHPHSARERGATNRAHGIFKGRHFADAGWPAAAGAARAPSDAAPRCSRSDALSHARVQTIPPANDRPNDGQLRWPPRPRVHAGCLVRGGHETQTHTKTEPPRARACRLRIIVVGQDHTFRMTGRKAAVSHRSNGAGVPPARPPIYSVARATP